MAAGSARNIGIMRAAIGALIALACVQAAQAGDCSGPRVYLDRNDNQRFDRGEKGVAGVRVSDGTRVLTTDRRGVYRFDTRPAERIFMVKPAGYAVPMRADGLPDTWNDEPAGGCRDFALHRHPRSGGDKSLRVFVFGDPQLKSEAHVGFYERDIVAPIRGRKLATLGITLGDLVDDKAQLYPALKAVDASLGLPWLHAPGNHDIDPQAPSDVDSLRAFHHAFGPATWAWEEAQANFIVLDDVIVRPGQYIIGGIREQQFAFLEAYLAGADRSRLLVLSMHVPLFNTEAGEETFRRADRERLFALLQPFPHVLVLSAHTHTQNHYFHGTKDGWHGAKPLHEFNVGAACGAYWTGKADASGIPDARMADGTPNGYALLETRAGAYDLRWFVARAPEQQQMTLHAPKVLRRGAYPAFGVYANVYMGHEGTQVEFRVDGGEWKAMTRVMQTDPALVAENALDDASETLRGFDRSPEASPSTHLWRGRLPTTLATGEHKVEVRAALEGFGMATATTQYRLDEPSGVDVEE